MPCGVKQPRPRSFLCSSNDNDSGDRGYAGKMSCFVIRAKNCGDKTRTTIAARLITTSELAHFLRGRSLAIGANFEALRTELRGRGPTRNVGRKPLRRSISRGSFPLLPSRRRLPEQNRCHRNSDLWRTTWRIPASFERTSILCMKSGEITNCADDYDGLTSLRIVLASHFTKWTEL